ncbi:hypothetical protein Salat_2242100 [Sesamum alatum]|uniref:Bifunctional inhibitor/plant lipid transfer protein/seed storage helical domain-containing protein n=1 Tax=Sesamum alatum TaxID=300844 RepID=A0AAE2CDM2_9LAMI|nr:hypothetical protein Salat_2242100 [Sesamum alatum]
MISSFTPCLNYVTGSSGRGSSPTEDCCNSLKSLMNDGMDCACLIVTGNVPLSIPFINRNLAISLPGVCQTSVPVQCKASGDPLPPPGPVMLGPTPTPSPCSRSPKDSDPTAEAAPPPAEISDIEPASPPEFSLAIHLILCYAILLLSGEMMKFWTVDAKDDCTEGLPWVPVICYRSVVVNQPCWDACRQRHGAIVKASCHSLEPGLPTEVCFCSRPC